MATNVLIIAAK